MAEDTDWGSSLIGVGTQFEKSPSPESRLIQTKPTTPPQCPYHGPILNQSGLSTPESGASISSSSSSSCGISTRAETSEAISIPMQRYLLEGSGEHSSLHMRPDNKELSTSRGCICVKRHYVGSEDQEENKEKSDRC